MATTELNLILEELNAFKGRIHAGVPKENVHLGAHDLIFLMKWMPGDLMQIARNHGCQVALYSQNIIPEPLSPFYDWRVFEKDAAEKLNKMAQEFSPLAKLLPREKPALFLDRDGVVNVDHGYVGKPENVELIPHVGELIHHANTQKREVVVVTNQSGIGRGFYSEENFKQVMQRISELLLADLAKIDWVEHSSYHQEAKAEKHRLGRQFRKPRPGMIHKAAKELGLDVRSSVMVGDHAKDLMAAALAGVGKIYLLATEEAESIQHEFQSWLEDLKSKHHLHLMSGVEFHVISGLNEAKLWR